MKIEILLIRKLSYFHNKFNNLHLHLLTIFAKSDKNVFLCIAAFWSQAIIVRFWEDEKMWHIFAKECKFWLWKWPLFKENFQNFEFQKIWKGWSSYWEVRVFSTHNFQKFHKFRTISISHQIKVNVSPWSITVLVLVLNETKIQIIIKKI